MQQTSGTHESAHHVTFTCACPGNFAILHIACLINCLIAFLYETLLLKFHHPTSKKILYRAYLRDTATSNINFKYFEDNLGLVKNLGYKT